MKLKNFQFFSPATRDIVSEILTRYQLQYHQQKEAVELCIQVDKTVSIKGEENKILVVLITIIYLSIQVAIAGEYTHKQEKQ